MNAPDQLRIGQVKWVIPEVGVIPVPVGLLGLGLLHELHIAVVRLC